MPSPGPIGTASAIGEGEAPDEKIVTQGIVRAVVLDHRLVLQRNDSGRERNRWRGCKRLERRRNRDA